MSSNSGGRVTEFFRGWKQWPPVLIPYLVVLVYAANQAVFLYKHYTISFLDLLGNVGLLLLFAFVLHFIWACLIRDRFLAGIMAAYSASIAVFYFDLYNAIWEFAPAVSTYIKSGYNVFLLVQFGGFGFFLFMLIRKRKKLIRNLGNYLSVIFILFFIVECVKAIAFHPFYPEFTNTGEEIRVNYSSKEKRPPDIYYIIFDSYTSSSSLQKYWNYDNSAIEDSLETSGFRVCGSSRANYNSTQYSISSCLNMSYLNVKNLEEDKCIPRAVFEALPSHSRLVEALQEKGYKVYALSLFDFMGNKNVCGIDYSTPSFFSRTLLQLIELKTGKAQFTPYYVERETNIIMLDSLRSIVHERKPQPVFCYTHIYLPHPPFFYNEKGEVMTDDYAFSKYAQDKYLSQLKYVNHLIDNLIHDIMPICRDSAIVIIQGDHGYRFLGKEEKWAVPEEGSSIMNACYFPGGRYDHLYDSVSPVNTFRIILNEYFGTRLEILPDTSYYLLQIENVPD